VYPPWFIQWPSFLCRLKTQAPRKFPSAIASETLRSRAARVGVIFCRAARNIHLDKVVLGIIMVPLQPFVSSLGTGVKKRKKRIVVGGFGSWIMRLERGLWLLLADSGARDFFEPICLFSRIAWWRLRACVHCVCEKGRWAPVFATQESNSIAQDIFL